MRPPSRVTSTRLIVPRPDQATPVKTLRPLYLSGACGDGFVTTDFASMTNVCLRERPSASRSVYFDVSSRVCHGWSPTSIRRSHFTQRLPSQPGITARNGIALLRTKGFSVHCKCDKDIVQRLVDRQRPIHSGGICAFKHEPFGIRLQSGFVQQDLERHTGVHDVVDHAVRELTAVELRAPPLHTGIRRAFEKMDLVHPRHALDVFHGEDKRLVDEPVDHQPVVGRVDLGNAAMMALEAKSGRRDNSVEPMQRREVHRRFRRGRQPSDVAPDHILFELRWSAIGPRLNPVAKISVPVLNFRDQRIGFATLSGEGRYRGKSRARAREPRGSQKSTAIENIRCRLVTHAGILSFYLSQYVNMLDATLHPHREIQIPVTLTAVFGSIFTEPSFETWVATTSQIGGPCVSSLTLAQPATA